MYIIYTYSLHTHTHIYIYSQLHAHVCEKCTIGHETLDPNHSMCIEQSFRIFGGDQLMIWVLQSGPSGEACMTQGTGTMRKSTRPTWPGRIGTKRNWWLGGDFFGVKWGAKHHRLVVWNMYFPTCQVRVVRFYVSCLLLSSSPLLLLLNRDPRRTVFSVGPQPRPSTPSVPCRTSTTTIPAQCSLPDLNHDHPRPVFPAGPQPRVSTPSVPCRTSCRKIWDKECAEES